MLIPVALLFDSHPRMVHLADIRHYQLPEMLSHLPTHFRAVGAGSIVINYDHIHEYPTLGGGFIEANYHGQRLKFFGQSNGGQVPISVIEACFGSIGYSIEFGPFYGDFAHPTSTNAAAKSWYSHNSFEVRG